MDEAVVLLSDHIWYMVENKEQAQDFINQHSYNCFLHYGIYIDKCGCATLLFKEEEE